MWGLDSHLTSIMNLFDGCPSKKTQRNRLWNDSIRRFFSERIVLMSKKMSTNYWYVIRLFFAVNRLLRGQCSLYPQVNLTFINCKTEDILQQYKLLQICLPFYGFWTGVSIKEKQCHVKYIYCFTFCWVSLNLKGNRVIITQRAADKSGIIKK